MAMTRRSIAPWPAGAQIRAEVGGVTETHRALDKHEKIIEGVEDSSADFNGRTRWRLVCPCGRLDRPMREDTAREIMRILTGRQVAVFDASLTDDILAGGRVSRRDAT